MKCRGLIFQLLFPNVVEVQSEYDFLLMETHFGYSTHTGRQSGGKRRARRVSGGGCPLAVADRIIGEIADLADMSQPLCKEKILFILT